MTTATALSVCRSLMRAVSKDEVKEKLRLL
jgi:hypothetical protein